MMPGDETICEAQVDCQGCAYRVAVSVRAAASSLDVILTQVGSLARWSGSFSAEYLEALTTKTCSPRRFEAFAAMLTAALRRNSTSVSIDILSFRDLENLRGGGESRSSCDGRDPQFRGGSQPPGRGGKRYLILTYASEFERVHYPLSLSPAQQESAFSDQVELHPHQQAAHSTERSDSNSGGGGNLRQTAALLAEISQLQRECSGLRRQLRHASRAARHSNADGFEAQIDQVLQERDSAKEAVRTARVNTDRVAAQCRRTERLAAHQAACAEADARQAQAEAARWRNRCQQLSADLEALSGRRRPSCRAAGNPCGATTPRASEKPHWGMPSWRERTSVRRRSAGGSLRSASPGRPPRAPLRPQSAPLQQRRFDPTDYVRQKQERELQTAARLGRRPVTPHAVRPPSSRSQSVVSAAASDASRAGTAHQRSASPGQALQDLKAKLDRQGIRTRTHAEDHGSRERVERPRSSRRGGSERDSIKDEGGGKSGGSRRDSLDAETARDMADIDVRLLALQQFLTSAKT